ncbi:MAG: ECF-type sigma factor [Pseudomonadota bacterium]
MEQGQDSLTGWLRAWSAGDAEAGARLFESVYAELRVVAARQLAKERPGHTYQPTALVNEAFLKLLRGTPVDWQDRVHFFAVSSRIIRQILVDHGRRRNAQRRGGGNEITLQPELHGETNDAVELLAIDTALDRLESLNERQARIVELRYFGGLTIEEVAVATEQSEATVSRQWRAARAWLYRQLAA